MFMPILLTTLSSSLFLVADNQELPAEEPAPVVTVKPVTELDFDPTAVNGQVVGPSGSVIFEAGKLSFAPLIQLRDNFNPEMTGSVAEVR